MAKAQIIKLRPLHEQIALSIMENPGITNRELSQQFGRTETWISIVRNSDCFVAKMRGLQDEADDLVVADIPTKLRVVADMALDRVSENLVQERCTPSYALGALKEALGALGYKPGGGVGTTAPVGTQNNYFFTASPKELATARERLTLNHEAPSDKQLLPEAVMVSTGG